MSGPTVTVTPGKLAGTLLIQPAIYRDHRGYFSEIYQADKYRAFGLDRVFVQDNFSFSRKNVLRGLHFQRSFPQGKLIYVVQGKIFDVAVDLRRDSPTFGCWEGYRLSDENHHQLYVPEGFAHGFAVLSDTAVVCYKCTDIYRPGDEGGVRWDDPSLGIAWPIDDPVLSEKDAALPLLNELVVE